MTNYEAPYFWPGRQLMLESPWFLGWMETAGAFVGILGATLVCSAAVDAFARARPAAALGGILLLAALACYLSPTVMYSAEAVGWTSYSPLTSNVPSMAIPTLYYLLHNRTPGHCLQHAQVCKHREESITRIAESGGITSEGSTPHCTNCGKCRTSDVTNASASPIPIANSIVQIHQCPGKVIGIVAFPTSFCRNE
jgi:hypothetical protein